jgi:hypothetical protein
MVRRERQVKVRKDLVTLSDDNELWVYLVSKEELHEIHIDYLGVQELRIGTGKTLDGDIYALPAEFMYAY